MWDMAIQRTSSHHFLALYYSPALEMSLADLLSIIYHVRRRTQGNLLCDVQEPDPTPPMSMRSGSNWDAFLMTGSTNSTMSISLRLFILTMIPPRIVRMQFKHAIDETIPIQPLMNA
ncbi:uncharacterized protein ARMOST_20729 [Armillaria ostoyae]|uniref:Uncharacterized protein n=1 Tax=Armillaria ostoyae TaxID=47428 RepID=A0A284S859_ARMOS|nr:uncharacterized protein ARMOST_20729 [Armillaria ostoyae]